VLEAAGVKNILAKSLGSANACNLVYATMEALKQLKSKEQVLASRGKSAENKTDSSAAGAA
jgi:small subunit ribosomal protein S5